MAYLSNCVIAWMVMIVSLKVDIVKGKGDFIKNTKSVFSLEERNLLALGRIFETLEKLAEPQANCKKEDETNEKLLSLISAVENTQNSVKIIAEANKNSTIDTGAKFETLLAAIQNTQDSIKVFAKSTSDAITKLQQTVLLHIPASTQTEMTEGTSTPVPSLLTDSSEITEGATTPAPTFSTVNSDLCGSPYFLVGEECFYVSRNEKDWDSAKLQCQREGGNLAAPEDLDLLRQHLKFSGDFADYWIGGHGKDGTWKWITGDPVEDGWGQYQPSGRTGRDCLDFRAGRWPSLYDYKCQTEQRYICERPYTGTVPPTLEPDDCSSLGGIKVAHKCLVIHEDPLNWHEAMANCTYNGGQLASLQNEEDPQMFHDFFEHYGAAEFWLGGSDIDNEGQWVWMNNQPIKDGFPWHPLEPNNAGGNEDCMLWRGHSSDFNDSSCDRRYEYICELDVSPTVKQTTETEPETTKQYSATETTLDEGMQGKLHSCLQTCIQDRKLHPFQCFSQCRNQ